MRQYIGVQNDVTARVEAERALSASATGPRATWRGSSSSPTPTRSPGLANRRRIEERLEVALWDARAEGTAVALLFLDLDGFKAVNDRLGHAAGRRPARRAPAAGSRARLRRADLLARLGGDEFLVALPHLDPETAREEATLVAAKLDRGRRAPVLLGGEQVQVGVSIGVSVFPDDGDAFGALLHAADVRMYAAQAPDRPLDPAWEAQAGGTSSAAPRSASTSASRARAAVLPAAEQVAPGAVRQRDGVVAPAVALAPPPRG